MAIELQMSNFDEQASQGAADQPAQHGNGEAVTEIRSAFAGDGKNRVRDARAQVARGIDGESGGASQARADGPDHGADQEGLETFSRWMRW